MLHTDPGLSGKDRVEVLIDRLADHRGVRVGVADPIRARDDHEARARRFADAFGKRLEGPRRIRIAQPVSHRWHACHRLGDVQ